MLSKGIKKYMMNPCWGLTPFLLYFLLYNITGNIVNSLVPSLLFAIVAEVAIKLYTKYSRSGFMFFIALGALLLTLLCWALFYNQIFKPQIFIVLPEIFLVCILIVIRLSKSYLNLKIFRKDTVLQKAFINEFFEVAAIIQYFFTLHIFIILIYKYLKDNQILSTEHDHLVYFWFSGMGIVSLILYENIKIDRMVSKLRKEEWLPIVNERGEVIGKIAKSVSFEMKNKFLHPIVRVALVYNGKIYLQPKSSDSILDPGSLDHPFEKYMLFNHEINLAVRNSIFQTVGIDLPFNFLLKYTFENENTKRLVFLFVSRVTNESEIENLKLLKGKFWSTKQIDDDFGKDSKFSECFQLEYEYLKNTILMTDEMLSNTAGGSVNYQDDSTFSA